MHYPLQRCCVCEREYEGPDMALSSSPTAAPSARCAARGRPLRRPAQTPRGFVGAVVGRAALLLPWRIWPYLDTGLGHFPLLTVVPLLATAAWPARHQELRALAEAGWGCWRHTVRKGQKGHYARARQGPLRLLVIAGIVARAGAGRTRAGRWREEESNRYPPAGARDRAAPPDRRGPADGQASKKPPA